MNVKMFIRNVHYTVHYEGKCVAHICSGKNVAKDRCCRVLFQFTLFFARMLLAQNGILCEYLQKIVIFGKMLWYSGQRKCFSLVVMGSSFGSVFFPTLAKLCIYVLMFNFLHKKYVSRARMVKGSIPANFFPTTTSKTMYMYKFFHM